MSKNNRRQESGWMFLRRSTDAQAEFTQPAIDQQRPMKQSPSRCEGSWARYRDRSDHRARPKTKFQMILCGSEGCSDE
ncbi:unnamed protein product [Caenorhabditis auriculariae]|uniref:Uncharacterized protein n=1 Tax=Caenorhabditis auriculariae TaxID=2777116 RepID=A0A8S1H5M3_9PELO|nr:unnamed protein product [Caenorhabditis auriculariae]